MTGEQKQCCSQNGLDGRGTNNGQVVVLSDGFDAACMQHLRICVAGVLSSSLVPSSREVVDVESKSQYFWLSITGFLFGWFLMDIVRLVGKFMGWE